MSFYYHMYGSTIESLEIKVTNSSDQQQTVFSKSYNQGNRWHYTEVYIPVMTDLLVSSKVMK